MRLLLDNGADVNKICGHHGSPLEVTFPIPGTSRGNYKLAKFLLNRGANLDEIALSRLENLAIRDRLPVTINNVGRVKFITEIISVREIPTLSNYPSLCALREATVRRVPLSERLRTVWDV